MSPPRKILVAVAWPYATGSLHVGHIAGAYLPPDVFARYHRAAGNDVLMVSGSDTHGTPITVKADEEGVSPAEIVDRYHPRFLGYWERLGVSFDLYTTTDTPTHHAVAKGFFMRLLENGHLYRKTVDQFYDEVVERFLPDRYIEGTCPHCGYERARGDQCDNCGRTLDPADLISPVSKISGATPILRATEHYYWELSAFQDRLLEWLRTRVGWRPHVINFAIGMVEEGLHDRAFTRDLDWGISLPVEDLGPGKSIYVWWEAVMGYYSAPQEWAALRGEPERWREWWQDPDAESYYFIGKDNIPFHAVYWPALLMGHGGLDLPTDVPANQYVLFGGRKASKSMGVGRPLEWYLDHFEADALRYAIAVNFPENNDTELYDEDMVRRVNEELVATWGNLVNRVFAMTERYFGRVVPEPGERDQTDLALMASTAGALEEVGASIEAVRLRAGLQRAMAAAQEVNAYLSDRAPWKTADDDRVRTATTIWVALNAIATVAVALHPYLPFTSPLVLAALGTPGEVTWAQPPVSAGHVVGDLPPLFSKMELAGDDD